MLINHARGIDGLAETSQRNKTHRKEFHALTILLHAKKFLAHVWRLQTWLRVLKDRLNKKTL